MATNRTTRPSSEQAVMPFGDHLEELRRRLILALLGLAPIFVLSMSFGRPMLDFLTRPVTRQLRASGLPPEMLATNFLETFGTYVFLSLVVTVLAGSPWVLYQLWKFVAPGLYETERRFVYILLPLSFSLTVTSAVFLYAVIMPVVLSFFIEFGSAVGRTDPHVAPLPEGIVLPAFPRLEADPPRPEVGAAWINTELMQLRVCVGYEGSKAVVRGSNLTQGSGIVQQYRISEYTKTFLTMAMAFALGFQTPVVVLLLGWAGLVKPAMLKKYRKHVIMGCCIAAALLTPADPISMALLAAPLWALFELGSVLLRLLPAERVARMGRRGQADRDGEA
ncbi:MAG: preprotein translocase subunit TatC [Leptolyngbya sp. PLA2]|nr:preprotein translocase subunit TatC [Leptolyngbya sp.]MCE7971056.1 preprotein translocase subunit TatC [Leptolyngbya sp. PL-A2]MCZ7635901.1 twin-arginine translocase subunit TatC [Verrucomicrobiota bacterium]MDL1905365.1 preprotein translocase subunit TatC [Synechococcales cyanobacterium CNB]